MIKMTTVGILLGCSLTFLGGLVRAISTMPGLTNSMSQDTQFWLSVVGQALTGMGNPLAVSVPTKVIYLTHHHYSCANLVNV